MEVSRHDPYRRRTTTLIPPFILMEYEFILSIGLIESAPMIELLSHHPCTLPPPHLPPVPVPAGSISYCPKRPKYNHRS